MELENIRRAARVLAGEREDPKIDKKIVVRGAGVSANLDVRIINRILMPVSQAQPH